MDECPREQLGQFHSWRMSNASSNSFDRSPKAAEINTGHPKSVTVTSSSPCHISARMLIPEHKDYQDFDRRSLVTTEKALGCMNSNRMVALVTLAKSVNAADGVSRQFSNSRNAPNYMAYTQSFEAKVRSQSTWKQSPEPVKSLRKMAPPVKMIESRASISGIGKHRSRIQAYGMHARFLNPGNATNYIRNTRLFETKVQSQSMPKQSLEPIASPSKSSLWANKMIGSSAGMSGVGMYRSCIQVCGTHIRLVNIGNGPNYMTKTQAFEAKARSQSMLKQSPEPIASLRKRPLLAKKIGSRAGMNGVGL